MGNVEIHVKASDWHRHGHDDDPAYDDIILHVVGVDDDRIHRKSGEEIPQAVLEVPPGMYVLYAGLAEGIDDVRCRPQLAEMPELVKTDWLETLSMERLHAKANRMIEVARQFGGDWRQALFVTLARALGFGLNSVPFELLAKSIPLNYAMRHSDNRFQLEALLFGQAGMLDSSVNIFDDYYQRMCREYAFLMRKYSLKPLQPKIWKYSRTRPQNFPHRRIALLAAALDGGFELGEKILQAHGDTDILEPLFSWEASEYWSSHSAFGLDGGGNLPRTLAKQSKRLILINLVAPYYFAYASQSGIPEYAEEAIDLLMGLPAEENGIIRQWRGAGLKAGDALRSQALIHLRKEYCDRGRCLECRFGHVAMRSASTRPVNIAL